MKVLTLLEQLATHAHYRVSLEKLTDSQSVEVKQAFLTNDSLGLKKQLGPTKNLADRDKVVHIK